jgi:copper(I)-binding protein
MNPETSRPTQLTEGVNVSRTDLNIQIRNLFVLGPAENATLPAGGSAPVYATLIDSATDGQPDRLIAVSSSVSGQPTALPGGGLELPVGQAVSLNGSNGTPQAVLTGLTKTLSGGEDIELAMQFQRAGVVNVTVPVVPQSGDFQTYPAAPRAVASTPAAASPTTSPKTTSTVTPAAKKRKKTNKSPTPSPTP